VGKFSFGSIGYLKNSVKNFINILKTLFQIQELYFNRTPDVVIKN